MLPPRLPPLPSLRALLYGFAPLEPIDALEDGSRGATTRPDLKSRDPSRRAQVRHPTRFQHRFLVTGSREPGRI